MIGFDRPLRPDWIYDFIRSVNVGDSILDHNAEFEKILWQLDGKEGKRKVRTVLTRYYLKNAETPNSKFVQDTPLIHLCKERQRSELEPLLLFYLLVRSPILRLLTGLMVSVYGTEKDINYRFLRQKIVERMGGRDISARSLRNFLGTLVNFKILDKKDADRYTRKGKLRVSKLVACYMLKIYSDELIQSPQLKLDDLDQTILQYFEMPDLDEIGKEYHLTLWEYNVRFSKKIITFHKNYVWKDKLIK